MQKSRYILLMCHTPSFP